MMKPVVFTLSLLAVTTAVHAQSGVVDHSQHEMHAAPARSCRVLGALDDPSFDRTVPDRVPGGLRVGGRLQP